MTPSPLCDIVLLTWNRADLLKPCVESITRHTKKPCRLILVDNASTEPEAVGYLNSLKGTDHVRLEIVRRTRNDGFSKGINDGLSRTTAPWVCVMNNDVIVTESWLDELLRVAEANPQIGLLNPMSNEFGTLPRRNEGPDETAGRLKDQQGRWMEYWNCVAFCMLLPRAVIEQVGLLDEKFQFMYYEDADYSMRVRQAGFICAIAKGCYVYHLGSATMNKNPEKEKLFEQNKKRFLERWAMPSQERIAWIAGANGSLKDAGRLSRQIRFLANQDHLVWVFCTKESAPAVPEHLNVFRSVLPKQAFYPIASLKILAKKKGFQKIVLPLEENDSRWIRWAQQLRRVPVSRERNLGEFS